MAGSRLRQVETTLNSHFAQLATTGIIPYFLLDCAGRALPDILKILLLSSWKTFQT